MEVEITMEVAWSSVVTPRFCCCYVLVLYFPEQMISRVTLVYHQ